MLKKFLPLGATGAKENPGYPEKLLEKRYLELVEQGWLEHDKEQWLVLEQLQWLLDGFMNADARPMVSLFSHFFSVSPQGCRSLYIYGAVGCGKSMLMQLFYESCPIAAKRRVHFNVFMQEVHLFVHQFQGQDGRASDPFSVLAETIKESYALLCFDEFQVTNIADAMILGRLFGRLFELDVIVVMTSNRHPHELYRGGLQQEKFLFFVKVLQEHVKIVELTAKKDFRLSHSVSQSHYYYPLDRHEPDFIIRHCRELADGEALQPKILEVFGRRLDLPATSNQLALVTFDELCVRSLAAADYLAIAQHYSYIILRGIPKLTPEQHNEAKRFIALIDVLYEHKTLLICSAEVSPQELYQKGEGAFEFKRAVSRLIEMQSTRYGGVPLSSGKSR